MNFRDLEKLSNIIMYEAISTAPGNVGNPAVRATLNTSQPTGNSTTTSITPASSAETKTPSTSANVDHTKQLTDFLNKFNENTDAKNLLQTMMNGMITLQPVVTDYIKGLALSNIQPDGKGLLTVTWKKMGGGDTKSPKVSGEVETPVKITPDMQKILDGNKAKGVPQSIDIKLVDESTFKVIHTEKPESIEAAKAIMQAIKDAFEVLGVKLKNVPSANEKTESTYQVLQIPKVESPKKV